MVSSWGPELNVNILSSDPYGLNYSHPGLGSSKPYINFINQSMLFKLPSFKFPHLYSGDNNKCVKNLQQTKFFIYITSSKINAPFYELPKKTARSPSWDIVEWGVKPKPSYSGDRVRVLLSCCTYENYEDEIRHPKFLIVCKMLYQSVFCFQL